MDCPESLVVAITRPIGRDISRIAHRQNVNVRRITEIIDDFEGGRCLSGDAIGIDRIHDREIFAFPELAHDAQRVIEVSLDRDDFGAVGESLNQFCRWRFCRPAK